MPHRLVKHAEAHHHTGFNRWLAVHITRRVGSMWAAYVFAAIALVSLPAALATGDSLVIVAWLAQTFLQLVLLPIILVGQRVQDAAGDMRAEAMRDSIDEILRILHGEHEEVRY